MTHSSHPSQGLAIAMSSRVLIDYFLRRYREDIVKRRRLEGDIEAQLADMELSLRAQNEGQFELALTGD